MPLSFVADENIDRRLILSLRDKGFSVLSIQELYAGATDKEVLDLAHQNHAILITEDHDFGEWVFSFHITTTGVILLRYFANDFLAIRDAFITLTSLHHDKIYNHFVVLSPKKFRFRAL